MLHQFDNPIGLKHVAHLFDIADCEEPVLIHDAVDIVDLMLPDAFPRFSRSPVLLCFFNFKPWMKQTNNNESVNGRGFYV